MALEEDDDLMQPVYQEPFQNMQQQLRGAVALNVNNDKQQLQGTAASVVQNQSTSSDDNSDNTRKDVLIVEPATLQLVRKGRNIFGHHSCVISMVPLPAKTVIPQECKNAISHSLNAFYYGGKRIPLLFIVVKCIQR
jgi:hypothetical protein